jgi:hypothetical protein
MYLFAMREIISKKILARLGVADIINVTMFF